MNSIGIDSLAADHSPRKTVLQIGGLRKTFGGQVVLDAVSAELREGAVVLLRGENGSGKTTLLNILSGNLEPDAGSIHLHIDGATEHFEFPRRWWQDLNPFDHFTPERVAAEGVGRTWQEVRLFGSMTLADNISVAAPGQLGENPANVLIRHTDTRRKERENREKALQQLGALGLKGRELSSADRISLGQSKRVAIARAVQAGARVLFLDEPLAGLDGDGINHVLELLHELAREHQVTLVIVEHVFNIPRILDLADTVWTLKDGRVSVESAAAVRAEHAGTFGTDIIAWVAGHLGHETTPTKQALTNGAVLWKFRGRSVKLPDAEPPLLEVQNLAVRRGNRLVIGREESNPTQELSFTMFRGETAVLQAPNGWGKTTLAEAIAGILPISQGSIILNGRRIDRLPVWGRVRAGLSFLPSRSILFPGLSVAENLQISRSDSNFPPEQMSSLIASLSGGERQRVGLATVKHTPFGIYDEPFSALDGAALAHHLRTDLSNRHEATLILLPHA